MRGYGGEISVGKATKAQYEFWKDQDESDMIDHMTGYSEELDIPKDCELVNNAEWYEGNIDHSSGAEMTESTIIEVMDEKGDTVWECEMDMGILEDQGLSVENVGYTRYDKDHEYAWWFHAFEKGQFFYCQWTVTEPFDPTCISIQTYEVEGTECLSSIAYKGEELDGADGWDTTGKSFSGEVYKVGE